MTLKNVSCCYHGANRLSKAKYRVFLQYDKDRNEKIEKHTDTLINGHMKKQIKLTKINF